VAAQVIVCRGPEGHVEIESLLDGDCCPAGAPTRAVHEVRTSPECEGCVDTPLLRAGLEGPARGALVAMVPASWRTTSAAQASRVMATVSPAVLDAARSRRSVVLLI